jgi:hypothetical protein
MLAVYERMFELADQDDRMIADGYARARRAS